MAKKIKKKKKPVRKKPTAKKKKSATKKAAKRATKKTRPAKKKISLAKVQKAAKPIGRVIHFYNHIGVAIVKFNVNTRAGTPLRFKGATTDFADTPKSMQHDHKTVAIAPKGKQIGVKVKKRVREGDFVYKSE